MADVAVQAPLIPDSMSAVFGGNPYYHHEKDVRDFLYDKLRRLSASVPEKGLWVKNPTDITWPKVQEDGSFIAKIHIATERHFSDEKLLEVWKDDDYAYNQYLYEQLCGVIQKMYRLHSDIQMLVLKRNNAENAYNIKKALLDTMVCQNMEMSTFGDWVRYEKDVVVLNNYASEEVDDISKRITGLYETLLSLDEYRLKLNRMGLYKIQSVRYVPKKKTYLVTVCLVQR